LLGTIGPFRSQICFPRKSPVMEKDSPLIFLTSSRSFFFIMANPGPLFFPDPRGLWEYFDSQSCISAFFKGFSFFLRPVLPPRTPFWPPSHFLIFQPSLCRADSHTSLRALEQSAFPLPFLPTYTNYELFPRRKYRFCLSLRCTPPSPGGCCDPPTNIPQSPSDLVMVSLGLSEETRVSSFSEVVPAS